MTNTNSHSLRASDLRTARDIGEMVLDLLVVIWVAAIVLGLPVSP